MLSFFEKANLATLTNELWLHSAHERRTQTMSQNWGYKWSSVTPHSAALPPVSPSVAERTPAW